MELKSLFRRFWSLFAGFANHPRDVQIEKLRQTFPNLPDLLIRLYRDQEGSPRVRSAGKFRPPARLMPISEVLSTHERFVAHEARMSKVGAVAWLWTDDNSNYAGVYVDGPLTGWICVLDHEEPVLTPAFRSASSFLSCIRDLAVEDEDRLRACDIASLVREIPETAPDAANAEHDWQLSRFFREQWERRTDKDLSRLFAMCAICLTPFKMTGEAVYFFDVDDQWIPEAAVRLLEIRKWREGVEQLERLARDGRPNGDSAAMRLLTRMNTNQSRQAVARLKQSLRGHKGATLEMWANHRTAPGPRRW